MFKHYKDIRASGKFQKIWPRWGFSWWVHERWTAADALKLTSQNIEANFQMDVIFINKPHI